MYPGTASTKIIPIRKTEAPHFRASDKGNKIAKPAFSIPAVNISETSTEYLIAMAAPGLRREDFSIEIAESVINIAAKKEIIPLSCVNDRCEYNYTDWIRAFTLPEDADGMLAQAVYQNGELVIHIPRHDLNKDQSKATIYVY